MVLCFGRCLVSGSSAHSILGVDPNNFSDKFPSENFKYVLVAAMPPDEMTDLWLDCGTNLDAFQQMNEQRNCGVYTQWNTIQP